MDCPLDVKDLNVFDEEMTKDAGEAMIATVWSRARKVAPCLKDDDVELDEDDTETVKSVVRSVVLRWAESGSGVVTSRTAGEYAESYQKDGGGGKFRPDEIRELQAVCKGLGLPSGAGGQKAYSIDMIPEYAPRTFHPFLEA